MKSVIIDRLIEIEESARTITSGLDKKEAGLPLTINAKCDEIERALKAKYSQNTQLIEQMVNEECKKKLAEIEEDYSQRSKKLEECFEEKHEEWEHEVFNKIIGR